MPPGVRIGPRIHDPVTVDARKAVEALAAATAGEAARGALTVVAREIDAIPDKDSRRAIAAAVVATIRDLRRLKDPWERATRAQAVTVSARADATQARADRNAAVLALLGPYTDTQDEWRREVAAARAVRDDAEAMLAAAKPGERREAAIRKEAAEAAVCEALEAQREAMRAVQADAAARGFPSTPTAVGRHVGMSRGAIATFVRPQEPADGVRLDREAAFILGPAARARCAQAVASQAAAEQIRDAAIHLLLASTRDGGLAVQNIEVAARLGLTQARVAQLRYHGSGH
jgi:hypothetical protein